MLPVPDAGAWLALAAVPRLGIAQHDVPGTGVRLLYVEAGNAQVAVVCSASSIKLLQPWFGKVGFAMIAAAANRLSEAVTLGKPVGTGAAGRSYCREHGHPTAGPLRACQMRRRSLVMVSNSGFFCVAAVHLLLAWRRCL